MLSFCPRGVLDEILNLIESVSEGFYFLLLKHDLSYNIIIIHVYIEAPPPTTDPSNKPYQKKKKVKRRQRQEIIIKIENGQ